MKKIAIVNTKCYRLKKNIYGKSLINKIKTSIGAGVVFTEYPGHAEKLVKDSSEYDIIIALGGDGTISEIVNRMNLKTQALAIIPLGTGNSLAHDLGINTLAKALRVIKNNKISKIDILKCQLETNNERFEKYHVTTSGIGFACATVALGNRYLKITGPFCYPISACLNSFNQKTISAKIKINDSPFRDIEFTNFLINNTKYAANTCVFPGADLKDSAFNLLFTKTNTLTQYLWNISIITKTYFYNLNPKTADRMHVILNKPSSFMLDGEIINYVKEIKYTVAPEALSVLV